MTDLEVLSKRLEAVEAQYMRVKRVFLLAGLVVSAGLVMGQVRPDRLRRPETPVRTLPETPLPTARVEQQIRAEQFILVGKNGKDRATLVSDDAGSVFLVLFDANGRTRVDLSVNNYGPSLTFLDPSGKERMVLGSTSLVPSHVASETGVVERTPPSSLVLLDRTGKVLWRAPS